MEENRFEKRNITIALVFYIFMFLILGGSIILSLIANLYIKNNPTVNFTELINVLGGLTDPNTLEEEMFKAYVTVGSLGNLLTYVITSLVVVFFMKDFLIGMGIGFAVGAIMVKSNKDLSKAVEKGKQMVEEKIEMGKDLIEENISKPKKQSSTKK